jgi:hypothetical protein
MKKLLLAILIAYLPTLAFSECFTKKHHTEFATVKCTGVVISYPQCKERYDDCRINCTDDDLTYINWIVQRNVDSKHTNYDIRGSIEKNSNSHGWKVRTQTLKTVSSEATGAQEDSTGNWTTTYEDGDPVQTVVGRNLDNTQDDCIVEYK